MINDIELNTKRSEENSKLNSNDDTMESIDLGLDFKIEKDDIVESVNKEDFFRSKNFKLKPTKKSFYFKRMGNTFTFWSNSDGEPLLVIGPHWPFYICLSSTITLICFLFFYAFWDGLSFIVRLIGFLIYGTQIVSYTYTFLKNPGIPKIIDESIEDRTDRKEIKFCNECHIFVNAQNLVYHCFDCNTCIEGYDHHCPWTSKCIGRGNLYGFYVFVISTMILFAYLIFALAVVGNPK